jgi:hypothetical protein
MKGSSRIVKNIASVATNDFCILGENTRFPISIDFKAKEFTLAFFLISSYKY